MKLQKQNTELLQTLKKSMGYIDKQAQRIKELEDTIKELQYQNKILKFNKTNLSNTPNISNTSNTLKHTQKESNETKNSNYKINIESLNIYC